jgi:hypothetical protein
MANAIWQECVDEARAIIGRMQLEAYPKAAIPNEHSVASKLYAERMGRPDPVAAKALDYGRPGRGYRPDGLFVRHRRK